MNGVLYKPGYISLHRSGELRKMLLRHVTYGLFIALFSLVFSGCADLDLEYEMEPDMERALSDQEQVMALAGASFRTLHNMIQGYESLAWVMGAMADHLTSPYCRTRGLSWEPRINSFLNQIGYCNYFQLCGQWEESYLAISYANSILRSLDMGIEKGTANEETNLLEAFSLFVLGVSYGYLGLVFDQAVLVKYDSDYTQYNIIPWNEIVDVSLEMMDRAIEISENHTFDVPPDWVGGQEMTNMELSQLANGYAARILVYSSRTAAQNTSVDWNRVLAYARKGITRDFAPVLGQTYDWYDLYSLYARMQGWTRVDMRIINLMDHDYPSRWPRDNVSWNTPDGMDPGEADPVDARLTTDFEYMPTNIFPPDRGYYHYSHYRCSRYDYLFDNVWYGEGSKPSFMSWEVKLLEAEALLRSGNEGSALSILNDPAGPRKSRGGLPDVQPADDILRYILDEKEIECYMTGAGISFFDMRRTDRLQPATLLHFPVPATELEIILLPHYTIHATPDGIDGSAGDWSGWDE